MATRYAVVAFLALISAGTAQAIVLGGVEVPREKMIVWILIGHSNMSGNNLDKADGTTAPRIWNYEWFKPAKQWAPAKEQPGRDAWGLSGRGEGGPGMPFLKGMALAYPQYHFGTVSNASVSCTLRGLNGGHNSSDLPPDQNRYWKGAELYEEIIVQVKAVQKDVTLGGVLCMLGAVEATRTSEEICRKFAADAALMVADLRADLGEPNLPFIMGEYEAGATATFALSRPWPTIVDQQIKLIPSQVPFTATIDSRGLQMLDDHHYNIVGQNEWARRTVEVIKAKGWVPGASAILDGARGLKDSRPAFRIFLSESGEQALFGRGGFHRADGRTVFIQTTNPR